MNKLFIRTALIAGATLALSACNKHPAVTNITTNDLNANMTMGAPANDASAMESVTNTAQPTAPASMNGSSTSTNGSTTDTGRGSSTNNVESNTVGM